MDWYIVVGEWVGEWVDVGGWSHYVAQQFVLVHWYCSAPQVLVTS